MKWTGHSDYKSMKPYIDIATRTKSDAMAKIAASWEEDNLAELSTNPYLCLDFV